MSEIEELDKLEEIIGEEEFGYYPYHRITHKDYNIEKAIMDRVMFYMKIGITYKELRKKYKKINPK